MNQYEYLINSWKAIAMNRKAEIDRITSINSKLVEALDKAIDLMGWLIDSEDMTHKEERQYEEIQEALKLAKKG